MKSSTRRVLLLFVATFSLLVGSLGAVGSAAPTVYYVDPGGSDADPGTADQPWETLQHAVDNVGPGDTIIVNPGAYAGMRIETSGLPDSWIRLRGAGTQEAVINRPGPNNRHGSNIEIETWEGDGTVAYWIIEGIEVNLAPNWGIDVRGNATNHSHHITIQDNSLLQNGVASAKSGIFFAFTDHVTVRRNESYGNGEHGLYLSNSGDHFTVRNNQFSQNERCGIHMNGDLSQGGDGTISHGRVDGNVIDSNGREGCAGINMDGVTDTVISNNLITANHASGITLFKQDGAVCSRRNHVINNTVVQASDGRWALVVGGTGCADNTIRNNIFLTEHPFRGAIEMPTADVPGLDSDYNIVADRFTVNDGNSIIDLAGWRTATGQDTNSFVASIDDLQFSQFSRPAPGSVAEDAGATVDLGIDIDLAPRPAGGGFDIGAHETPYCGGLAATIVGTRRADSLAGTDGPDVIAALGGDDFVEGEGGADTICGGDGRDTIVGGPGNDTIRGNRRGDQIRGNSGNDTIYGRHGPDDIGGGPGDDRLRGNRGVDTINGGGGTDNCRAETVTTCE